VEVALKEFTVLLEDSSVVMVRGNSLKLLEASGPEAISYAVMRTVGAKEVPVALFRANQVIGIFNGVRNPSQDSA